MRWAGYVARMEEKRGIYRVVVGKCEGNNHLEDPGLDGRIILRWMFRTWEVRTGNGWSCLRIGTGASTCECGNEPLGCMKRGEFLD